MQVVKISDDMLHRALLVGTSNARSAIVLRD
jgi:hypothetical protein